MTAGIIGCKQFLRSEQSSILMPQEASEQTQHLCEATATTRVTVLQTLSWRNLGECGEVVDLQALIRVRPAYKSKHATGNMWTAVHWRGIFPKKCDFYFSPPDISDNLKIESTDDASKLSLMCYF